MRTPATATPVYVGSLLPGVLAATMAPAPVGAASRAATLAAPTTAGARTRRIGTLRLVREDTFEAPAGYADARTPIPSPRDVYTLMAPYAAREVGESF